jgi:hypothetical protein
MKHDHKAIEDDQYEENRKPNLGYKTMLVQYDILMDTKM